MFCVVLFHNFQINAGKVVTEELNWSDQVLNKLLPLVYAYWLSKRSKLNKPLCRKFWPQVTSSDTNPRQVFRYNFVACCVKVFTVRYLVLLQDARQGALPAAQATKAQRHRGLPQDAAAAPRVRHRPGYAAACARAGTPPRGGYYFLFLVQYFDNPFLPTHYPFMHNVIAS